MYFTQSKKSGAINPIIIALVLLIGLAARVSAHGLVITPPMRFVAEDDEYTKIKMASDPTTKKPCGADGYGPTTVYKPGEWMYFAYNVSIPHPGACYIQMNMHGDDKEENFHTVHEFGECGKEVGLKTTFVEVPHETCEKCTLRFMWDDDLGNSYLNCANIKIAEPHMRRRRSARRSLRF
jgi:hypothetical protein